MNDAETRTFRAAIQRILAGIPVVSLPTEADVRDELSGLKLKELLVRVRTIGLDEDQIEEAEDADNPKVAIIELVVSATPFAAEAAQPASLPTEAELREELNGLRLKDLVARATLLGIDEDQIDAAEDAANPKAAAIDGVHKGDACG